MKAASPFRIASVAALCAVLFDTVDVVNAEASFRGARGSSEEEPTSTVDDRVEWLFP